MEKNVQWDDPMDEVEPEPPEEGVPAHDQLREVVDPNAETRSDRPKQVDAHEVEPEELEESAHAPDHLQKGIEENTQTLTHLVKALLTEWQVQTRKIIKLNDDVRSCIKQAESQLGDYQHHTKEGEFARAGASLDQLTAWTMPQLIHLFDDYQADEPHQLSTEILGNAQPAYTSLPSQTIGKGDNRRFLAVNFIIAVEGEFPLKS